MAEKTVKTNDNKIVKKKLRLKFFKDIKSELKKVTRLTWPQLVKNTLTVIAACLMIGVIIWIFDAAIGKLISLTLLR